MPLKGQNALYLRDHSGQDPNTSDKALGPGERGSSPAPRRATPEAAFWQGDAEGWLSQERAFPRPAAEQLIVPRAPPRDPMALTAKQPPVPTQSHC